MSELALLKLGGSLISEKRSGGGVREGVVRAIASELAKTWHRPLIIVHGAGSYGHPIAREYDVAHGYRSPRNLEGFIKTSSSMRRLNARVVELLMEGGLPSFGVPASLIFKTRNGRIESANLEPILASIDVGVVPVTCGDVVFDRERKFTVLSGDSIIIYLARRMGAKRIVFATDVEGVYFKEEETGGEEVIPVLRKGMHLRVKYKDIEDVTGGMAAKIDEAFEAVEAGINVVIVSGFYPDRVARALMGETVRGTMLSIE